MSKKISQASLIPQGRIEHAIFSIRGHRVMLSPDLATLYGVSVSALIQAVKRNARRFPGDFMFQLNREEFNRLKSQFVTLGKSPRDLSP
jgi:ORF6N domain